MGVIDINCLSLGTSPVRLFYFIKATARTAMGLLKALPNLVAAGYFMRKAMEDFYYAKITIAWKR